MKKQFGIINPEELAENMKTECKKYGKTCCFQRDINGRIIRIIGIDKVDDKIVQSTIEFEYIEEKKRSIRIAKYTRNNQIQGIALEDTNGYYSYIDYQTKEVFTYKKIKQEEEIIRTSYTPELNPRGKKLCANLKLTIPINPSNIHYDELLQGIHPDADYWEKRHIVKDPKKFGILVSIHSPEVIGFITKYTLKNGMNYYEYNEKAYPKGDKFEADELSKLEPEKAESLVKTYDSRKPALKYLRQIALQKIKERIKKLGKTKIK